MSKIITIGEHSIQLPPLPKSKKDILFVDEKPKDAYWRRDVLEAQFRQIWFEFIPYVTQVDQAATLYDQDGMLTSLNKDDSDYIRRTYVQEFDRRTKGVYFRNGDEFEYLSGHHYFLLMWAKMNNIGGGDYASFFHYQRDFFYLIDYVNSSKHIAGLNISKPKKTGITNLMWSGYFLNKATLTKNQNMSCMNIDQGQAAKTFKDYFQLSFNGLPNVLKPQVKSLSPQVGRIEFGKAFANSKKNRMMANDSSEELNTNVFCVPTAPKANDVAAMDDTWYDEGPKYKHSFEDIITTNSEAIKMGAYLKGRMWFTSYTPDQDTPSFREAREYFKKSALRTRGENGRTQSEMIAWHIPSYYSWFGENNDCIDKHGRCDQAKANREIDRGRAAVKNDPRKLQALTRQYAKNAKEAWQSAGAGSTFDLVRFGELSSNLGAEDYVGNPYMEGFLEWKDKSWETLLKNKRPKGTFGDVEFVPYSESDRRQGKEPTIRMFYDIPASHRNMALRRGRDEWGNLLRPEKIVYAIGGDPTSYAAGSEVIKGSKNAGHILSLPNDDLDVQAGDIASNLFHLEYYHRPEMHEDAYENYLKMIIYTGAVGIIEANQAYVATRLMEEGLGHYMIVKNKKGIMCFWERWMGLSHEEDKKYTLIKNTARSDGSSDIMDSMIRLYKNYFYYHGPGTKDYGATCKSERMIDQASNLNPLDTKLADVFMSGGYAFIASDTIQSLLVSSAPPAAEAEIMRALYESLQEVG